MAQVDQQISVVRSHHESVLAAADGTQHDEAAMERDREVAATNSMVSEIKSSLKRLDGMLEQSKHDSSITKSQRIARTSRYQGLVQKFSDQLQRYRQMEYQYSQRNYQRIARQYRIARPNATDNEIQEAISNNQAGQVFAQDVMQSNHHGKAKRVLREVEQRQADLKNIEKTISQLAEMFIEVSELVNQQQETIDSIETAVEETHTNVEEGNTMTTKAIEHRKSSRKKMWWILIIVIIIIAVVAVVVYLKVK